MSFKRPTRRRAITIFASAVACAVAGPARPATADHEWRGSAMGADARLLFSGVDPQTARNVASAVEAEIERLETALSLFHPKSELCCLNRAGQLVEPSGDLRRALALALRVADLTNGLFDPTVQTLWEAHVDWFARGDRVDLPPGDLIARARRAVNWRKIELGADAVRLGDGQRLTLNGLGQGYVTDRVAELLAARGLTNILIDLGEQRALGTQRDGSPWLVERTGAAPLRLAQGALATSEGTGCVLGAGGAAHHLFDPRSGRSAAHWRTITVHHTSAAVADALSTALSIASVAEIEALLPRLDGVVLWSVDRTGQSRRWPAAGPVDGIDG